MKRFVQIHALVSYPPSNLNRDDMGRPKTAVMGGKQRLRISSQSIKRAWRESEFFSDALSGHVGVRTKLLGEEIKKALVTGNTLANTLKGINSPINKPMEEKNAITVAEAIAGVFAKVKGKGDLKAEQMVHISHNEISSIDACLEQISKAEKPSLDKEKLGVELCRQVSDVDIALFGRMIADSPQHSIEAAAQVAHPISIHPVIIEDDYFTAVDDLNQKEGISGSAHIGVAEFGAGIFYTYVCINRELLIENLNGDTDLASKAIKALIECVAKIGPKGKQNSYASRVYASYLMVEQGNQQPRALSAAFLAPLKSDNYLEEGIARLRKERDNLEQAYGKCADNVCEMSVSEGKGSLEEILNSIN